MLKEVKIELTNRCFRNCKHCSSSAIKIGKNAKELAYEDVKRIILEAKSMGVKSIVFTGGEPLMYEHLEELIKYTKELNMESTIYSFAYRNDSTLKIYKKLVTSGLSKIIYSLAQDLSLEEDYSTYPLKDFFDIVMNDSSCKLGFHYAVSKDSITHMKEIISLTIQEFKDSGYFDKISLLRFVPHGRGTEEMDLSKEQLLLIKDFYLSLEDKSRIRLGSPWNILGLTNHPCVIADEIMIIGFDGIAYPCDSVKYFTHLGVSGNINEKTLQELYDSIYFKTIRNLVFMSGCNDCKDYIICKGGFLGQKMIAGYQEKGKQYTLTKCIQSKDPKCMR